MTMQIDIFDCFLPESILKDGSVIIQNTYPILRQINFVAVPEDRYRRNPTLITNSKTIAVFRVKRKPVNNKPVH
jgi:hypothetical protein